MQTSVSTLEDLIIKRITDDGPISFRDFMEMSLYYPKLGYYTSGTDKIGKNGDYYTSPWLSSVFGEMIALQLQEMWTLLGKKDFTIVEFGAGNGSLCADILRQLSKNPGLYQNLKYCIVEKQGRIPDEQKMKVPGILEWYESPDDIPAITNGCVLSNELVDNFSVSQVVMQDELMEVFVDYRDGFIETLRPASSGLKNYLQQLGVELPRGFRTEINLHAIEWINQVAEMVKQGFVMTIDYGYLSPEIYSHARRLGTLVCYYRHQVNFCPYQHIGQQDITSHVNFSALHYWGRKKGLHCCGFTNQANFLLGLGLSDHLKNMDAEIEKDPGANAKKAVMLHTFLAGMGRKFKVLVQNKGLDQPRLSGLRFCQPVI